MHARVRWAITTTLHVSRSRPNWLSKSDLNVYLRKPCQPISRNENVSFDGFGEAVLVNVMRSGNGAGY